MSESSWYRVNRPSVIHEAFEDEYVIVNLKTGAYYALNSIGAKVWDWLERGNGREEIVAALVGRYSAEPTQISGAVDTFLGELQEEGLILPQTGTRPVAPPTAAADTLPAELAAFAPPQLQKYTDMQELLLLDPIHEVDESGWPQRKPI